MCQTRAHTVRSPLCSISCICTWDLGLGKYKNATRRSVCKYPTALDLLVSLPPLFLQLMLMFDVGVVLFVVSGTLAMSSDVSHATAKIRQDHPSNLSDERPPKRPHVQLRVGPDPHRTPALSSSEHLASRARQKCRGVGTSFSVSAAPGACLSCDARVFAGSC